MKVSWELRFGIVFAIFFSILSSILSVFSLLQVREIRKEFELCRSYVDEFDQYYQERTSDEINPRSEKVKYEVVEGDNDQSYEENYVDDEEYSDLEDVSLEDQKEDREKRRKTRSSAHDDNSQIGDEPKFKLNWSNGRKNDPNEARINHRRNRVQHSQAYALSAAPVEHVSGLFHNKSDVAKQIIDRSYSSQQEKSARAPLQWSHQERSGRRMSLDPERKNLEKKRNFKKTTAIHFEGDSSSLILGHSPGFLGNGKVKLTHNIYSFWTPASWTHLHGMHNYFSMDGGKLTVKDHGLFLVYAQVFYSDVFDTNGYSIEQNDVVKFQCVTTIHTETRVNKINTCSTSGLIYLNYGDKIWIKDLGNHRHVLLEPSKSFFGLMKVNIMQPPIVENREVESFEVEK